MKLRFIEMFQVRTKPLPRPVGRGTSRREGERGRAESGVWDAVSYGGSVRWVCGWFWCGIGAVSPLRRFAPALPEGEPRWSAVGLWVVCGWNRCGEPSQALRASSPGGRAKGLVGIGRQEKHPRNFFRGCFPIGGIYNFDAVSSSFFARAICPILRYVIARFL